MGNALASTHRTSTKGTSTQETERKYDVDGATTDPGELVADARPAEREQLRAVYYDTRDLRLLQARITMRRREGGHDQGWHLKLPGAGDTREEIALPLRDGSRTPPKELLALTRVYTRGRPLVQVAQLDTDRQRWLLSDGDGRELAELTQDDVTARTMGDRTRAATWREVEVELGEHGEASLLDRIEQELLRGGARRSKSASKVGRLLTDDLPDVPAGTRPPEVLPGSAGAAVLPGSAGAAVLDYVAAQADRIRALDPQVRRDTPDALHQMRVSARRMRSALQAYRRILDREQTAPLVEELKWLGGQLDSARDAEVIERRLLTAVEGLPDELVLGPVGAHVTRAMQRRLTEGRRKSLAALDSTRYLRLHDCIDELLADPPLTGRADRPARRELPRHVAKVWRRVQTRWTALNETEHSAEHSTEHSAKIDEVLHDARKAAKRLRYAVEVAQPYVGKRAKPMRRRLKELNTTLGDHQDTVVARPVIRQLAVEASREGGNGFTYGVLHGREEAAALRARQALPSAWGQLDRRRNRAWLGR